MYMSAIELKPYYSAQKAGSHSLRRITMRLMRATFLAQKILRYNFGMLFRTRPLPTISRSDYAYQETA
jgi:hypothetical protein